MPAARAACVSTWLGEVRQEHQSWLATNSEPCTCTQSHLSPRARFHFLRSDKKDLRIDVVNHCQTLPGLPRAAWPSGRFAEVATCLVNIKSKMLRATVNGPSGHTCLTFSDPHSEQFKISGGCSRRTWPCAQVKLRPGK